MRAKQQSSITGEYENREGQKRRQESSENRREGQERRTGEKRIGVIPRKKNCIAWKMGGRGVGWLSLPYSTIRHENSANQDSASTLVHL
jgi:hypothetical protein